MEIDFYLFPIDYFNGRKRLGLLDFAGHRIDLCLHYTGRIYNLNEFVMSLVNCDSKANEGTL